MRWCVDDKSTNPGSVGLRRERAGSASQIELDGEGLLAPVYVEAPDHQGLFAVRILPKEY